MFRFIFELRRGAHFPGRLQASLFKKLAMLTAGLAAALFSITALWGANTTVAGVLAGEIKVDASGALTHNLPLQVAPGINDMTPELSLAYNSRNKQPGILGVGWTLNGLSTIYRCGKSRQLDEEVAPVEYNNSDRLCVDGARLIASTGSSDAEYWSSGAKYHTYEESWVRYERVGSYGSHGPSSFTAKTNDGRTLTYNDGGQGDSNYGLGRWYLTQIKDRNNNQINITYHNTGGTKRPNEIIYNTDHRVKFRYKSTSTSNYDRQVFLPRPAPTS